MKKPKYPYRIGIIFLLLTVPPIGATQLGWYLHDQQTGFDYGMIVGTVSVVYAGVKGLIDEVPVEEVTKFASELREYLKLNKSDFINEILKEKKLNEGLEATLKEVINEVKSLMLAKI